MTTLRDLIVELDTRLTGKAADAARAASQKADLLADPVAFIENGEYYLSDGGYSRIVFSEVSQHLFLTSNSRDAVKARWTDADVQGVVARIDRLLKQAMDDALGSSPSSP